MKFVKENMEITVISEVEKVALAVKNKVEKYKNLVVTQDTRKELKELLDNDLKVDRKDLKDYRASLNKNLKSLSKSKLDEVDNIINNYNEVIKPIQEGLGRFAEVEKERRLQEKKDATKEKIAECNEVLKGLGNLRGMEVKEVEFLEEYANKKLVDIEMLIENQFVDESKRFQNALDRLELLEIKRDGLVKEYNVNSEIDVYDIDNIFSRDKKEILEELEELVIKRANLEIELERKKLEKEEKEKREKEQKEMKLAEVVDEATGEVVEKVVSKEVGEVKATLTPKPTTTVTEQAIRRVKVEMLIKSDDKDLITRIERSVREVIKLEKIRVTEV